MSAQDNSIQTQLQRDEANVLASFQLANEHLHIGDTHPDDGRAEKMQKVSVTVQEVLNVLEDAGFVSPPPTFKLVPTLLIPSDSIGRPSLWL